MGPLKKISMKDKVGLVKPLVVIAALVLVGTVFDVVIAQRTLLADPPKPYVHKISPGKIPTTPQPAEGEVLLKYSESVLPGKTPEERAKQMDKLAAALRSKFNITVLSNSGTLGVQRIQLPVGLSIVDAIAALTKEAGIERASPNYKIYPATSPNDPEWTTGYLWGLKKIGMERAWNYSIGHAGFGPIGHSRIVIAVIDSGIDYGHPDLAANMWTNPGEIPGDGIDNDANGIVDDIHGANFCTNPSSGDPMDTEGHGTLVAGTIAAVGDNKRDVVGVNWYAKLMALKFICYTDQNGVPYGLVSDAIDAIVYATDHYVPVMNNSWQVAGSSLDLSGLLNAIQRANCELLPNPGCQPALFVAAAGNADGVNTPNNDSRPTFPASFPIDNVIAVAATMTDDRLWPDSKWGPKSVHIAAPGVGIESTYLHTQYGGLSETDGTSMAAPHVAGCAALLQARESRLGGLFSIGRLKDALMNTGDSLPVPEDKEKIMSGRRLNCGRAMSSLFDPPVIHD